MKFSFGGILEIERQKTDRVTIIRAEGSRGGWMAIGRIPPERIKHVFVAAEDKPILEKIPLFQNFKEKFVWLTPDEPYTESILNFHKIHPRNDWPKIINEIVSEGRFIQMDESIQYIKVNVTPTSYYCPFFDAKGNYKNIEEHIAKNHFLVQNAMGERTTFHRLYPSIVNAPLLTENPWSCRVGGTHKYYITEENLYVCYMCGIKTWEVPILESQRKTLELMYREYGSMQYAEAAQGLEKKIQATVEYYKSA